MSAARVLDDTGLSPAAVLDRQLDEVADRLCRRFAGADGPSAESVRRQVREALAAFGSPTVTAYLPLLIERQLREELAAARARHGGRSD